jgi:hypothetical protein
MKSILFFMWWGLIVMGITGCHYYDNCFVATVGTEKQERVKPKYTVRRILQDQKTALELIGRLRNSQIDERERERMKAEIVLLENRSEAKVLLLQKHAEEKGQPLVVAIMTDLSEKIQKAREDIEKGDEQEAERVVSLLIGHLVFIVGEK